MLLFSIASNRISSHRRKWLRKPDRLENRIYLKLSLIVRNWKGYKVKDQMLTETGTQHTFYTRLLNCNSSLSGFLYAPTRMSCLMAQPCKSPAHWVVWVSQYFLLLHIIYILLYIIS